MNKNKALLALPAALILAACGGTSSEEELTISDIRFMSPTGAPAIVFADQGANENWETGTATEIRPQFATNNYDALVIDSTTGIGVIDAQDEPYYKLATFLTGGNFHLVSVTHTADEAPTSESKFLSFNSGSVPDSVFLRLASEHWGWDFDFVSGGNINYVSATSDVATQLISSPETYDYYFIAEPSLLQAKTSLEANGYTVNEIYDLREEWESYSGQTAIPQAALFVNTWFYEEQSALVGEWLEHIGDVADAAINDPDTIVSYMNAYSEDTTEQASRFGFNVNQVASLQADGANRFGVVGSDEIEDNRAFINEFYYYLTGEAGTYGEELFL